MSEVDLLAYLALWHAEHVAAAAERGITLTLSRTGEDRPKTAAWITGTRGDHDAQLVVWSSGEAEFTAGTPGNPTANEHHELEGSEELEALLDRLLSVLQAAST